MKFLRPICVSLILLATPVFAQDLSPEDQTALQLRVDSFDAAFRENDFANIIGAMPAKMKTFIAKQANASIEDLERAMITQTQIAMSSITMEHFEMMTDAAETGATPEGRAYALIPTNTVMQVQDAGKFESQTTTLGLKDDGKWFLLRIDEQKQVDLLRAVYPDFSDIEFPEGSMTQVTE